MDIILLKVKYYKTIQTIMLNFNKTFLLLKYGLQANNLHDREW